MNTCRKITPGSYPVPLSIPQTLFFFFLLLSSILSGFVLYKNRSFFSFLFFSGSILLMDRSISQANREGHTYPPPPPCYPKRIIVGRRVDSIDNLLITPPPSKALIFHLFARTPKVVIEKCNNFHHIGNGKCPAIGFTCECICLESRRKN